MQERLIVEWGDGSVNGVSMCVCMYVCDWVRAAAEAGVEARGRGWGWAGQAGCGAAVRVRTRWGRGRAQGLGRERASWLLCCRAGGDQGPGGSQLATAVVAATPQYTCLCWRLLLLLLNVAASYHTNRCVVFFLYQWQHRCSGTYASLSLLCSVH